MKPHVPETNVPKEATNIAAAVLANPDPAQEGLQLAKTGQKEELYVSISKKSWFKRNFQKDLEVELNAKLHEVKPENIIFEFRGRVDPLLPVSITKEDIPLLQHNYMRIKPRDMDDFLAAYHDDSACELHLVSLEDSSESPYFPLFGLESS